MLDSKTGKPKPSWVPPTQAPSQSSRPPSLHEAVETEPAPGNAAADEGFSRFYSTFGNIINRLSTPLAFAGLPLITEESTAEITTPEVPPQKRDRGKAIPPPGEEPDLSKIYSKAALRAVHRDGHAVNDSFYVVPTSGHTVSYANILNFDQKERRRAMAASLHEGEAETVDDPDEDDFVDARESQASISPKTKRRVGKSQTERDLYNVIEELSTENASLKSMLDRVTKRLQLFEASAQHSRLALADSMRIARPGSPMSHSGGAQGPAADEALKRRNQDLEEELLTASKQFEVLEKDNKRLRHNLDKYRDKWESLKAGAKARRDAAQSTDT
jgi:FtsZ-binding cell division protein ZapB